MSRVQWTAVTCIESVGVVDRSAGKKSVCLASSIYIFNYILVVRFPFISGGARWPLSRFSNMANIGTGVDVGRILRLLSF